MKQSTLPPHLPQPPRNRAHYESLYRYGYGGGAGDENDVWHERRIPANLSAANVYRMLPSASDFEYGGYLTKTRIRYVVGAPESVSPPYDLPCVFHSHPFAHPYADAPSPLDIYQFNKCECLRGYGRQSLDLGVEQKSAGCEDCTEIPGMGNGAYGSRDPATNGCWRGARNSPVYRIGHSPARIPLPAQAIEGPDQLGTAAERVHWYQKHPDSPHRLVPRLHRESLPSERQNHTIWQVLWQGQCS